jgi:hypothetical protein
MSVLDDAHDQVGSARERLERTRQELRSAVAADGADPARDVDDALARVELLRTAIGRDAATLRARASTSAERTSERGGKVVAAGAGLVGLAVTAALGRRRSARRRGERALDAQAVALARALDRLDAPTGRPRRRGRGLLALGAIVGAGAAVALVTARRRAADEDLWLPEA